MRPREYYKLLEGAQARTLGREIKDIPDIKAVGVIPLFSTLIPSTRGGSRQPSPRKGQTFPVSMSYEALPKCQSSSVGFPRISECAPL